MYTKPIRGKQLNKAHPLARGLTLAYLLNEQSGAVVYDYAGQNHGDFYSAPSWSAGGILFEGTSSYIVSRASIGVLTELTIAIKVRPMGTADGGWVCIGTSNNNRDGYTGLRRDEYTEVRGCYYNGTGVAKRVNAPENTLPVGTAKTVVLTARSGENPSLYVDGINVSTLQEDSNDGNAGDGKLYIGAGVKGPGYSWIEYVYIWTRVLTDEEINVVATQPYCMFSTRSTWDIGAFEYVASGGGGVSIIPIIMNHLQKMRAN